MELVFLTHAWEDYLYWQTIDKKMLKRVNELIKQCQRTPFEGIGKPEGLKGDLSGCTEDNCNASVGGKWENGKCETMSE